MSTSNTCGCCAFFHQNDDDKMPGGYCWRFPPMPLMMQQPATVLGAGGVSLGGVSPPVGLDHTCGEFSQSDPCG